MINKINTKLIKKKFLKAKPFNYVIIDSFWSKKNANLIHKEINKFTLNNTNAHYDNAIEKKLVCNHYDKFDLNLYNAFCFLNSSYFLQIIKNITGIKEVVPDVGLHGGGLHIHPSGGKLNVHKDYSIHPKLKMERRLNLIIYMTKNWKSKWGGELQLWSHDKKKNQPLKLEQNILNKFNRAILFDTTQNSWHGLPNKIKMPKPLSDGLVEYSDGTLASEEQMAKDVTTFLMWTAEPHLETRHKIGFKAIVYLIILTILVYFSMKKIWSRVESEV